MTEKPQDECGCYPVPFSIGRSDCEYPRLMAKYWDLCDELEARILEASCLRKELEEAVGLLKQVSEMREMSPSCDCPVCKAQRSVKAFLAGKGVTK